MAGNLSIKTSIWPVVLTVLGAAAITWIVPNEITAVKDHILGFPDTDIWGHQLRPWLLGLLVMLPAIAAWMYQFSGTLDRYMARQFLVAFSLCMGTLLLVFVLMDLQNNIEDFKEADDTIGLVLTYYKISIPALFVFLLPYVLLLTLLYSLGKMSRHQEIVAMIQTGRGVLRIVAPLLVTGIFTSLICLIFNYHWGPWVEGHKDIVIDIAKSGKADQARSVLFRDSGSGRVWLVGAFPYLFEKTGTIHNVTVKEFNDQGHPINKLEAKTATWSKKSKSWEFYDVTLIDLEARPIPVKVNTSEPLIRDWQETPWQLIKPGLDQSHLGIPELNSWLKAHENVEWANHLPYLTQWHYRFSQPVICLITILLAAPLGIVFSRRGLGGGVSIAVFLCAGMLFASSFFLTFGEAGHLPPALAAWGTNIMFTLVALYLFHRRLTGRPIYQSLIKLLSIDK